MKPHVSVNCAVQALAIERSGHIGSVERKRHNGLGKLYVSKHGTYKRSTGLCRDSKHPPALQLRAEYNISAPADIWNDSFLPESPPPLPTPSIDKPSEEDLVNRMMKCNARSSTSAEDDSEKCTWPDSISTFVSEVATKNASLATHVIELSATIFPGSTQAPISILVTAPAEEVSDVSVKPLNLPNFSPAALKSDGNSDRPNPRLLMPPLDKELNPLNLRKMQEFREIQKWLITFLNSKGDRFPRKVRLRMMDLYHIQEADLSLAIVTKFRAEADKGVVLDRQDEGADDTHGLGSLSAAFRSHLVPLTRRNETLAVQPPPSWQLQRGQTRRASVKSSESLRAIQPESIATRNDSCIAASTRTSDLKLTLSWMAPLISTSTCSKDSMLEESQYLKRSCSAPNLKSSRPQLSGTTSSQSVPGLRSGSFAVAGRDAAQKSSPGSRSSFISGAFGAMKDVIRRPSKRGFPKERSWRE